MKTFEALFKLTAKYTGRPGFAKATKDIDKVTKRAKTANTGMRGVHAGIGKIAVGVGAVGAGLQGGSQGARILDGGNRGFERGSRSPGRTRRRRGKKCRALQNFRRGDRKVGQRSQRAYRRGRLRLRGLAGRRHQAPRVHVARADRGIRRGLWRHCRQAQGRDTDGRGFYRGLRAAQQGRPLGQGRFSPGSRGRQTRS